MYGLNSVQLIGNLGQDPELKYTSSQTAVANFSVATNESYNKDGQKFEKTEWHRCVAWGKTAEIISQFATKGSKIYIQGKLATRSWEDSDGVKKYQTEIVVNDFMFLDGGSKSEKSESKPSAAKSNKAVVDDDLPF